MFLEYQEIKLIENTEKWVVNELQGIISKINSERIKTGNKEEPYRSLNDDEKLAMWDELFKERIIKGENRHEWTKNFNIFGNR